MGAGGRGRPPPRNSALLLLLCPRAALPSSAVRLTACTHILPAPPLPFPCPRTWSSSTSRTKSPMVTTEPRPAGEGENSCDMSIGQGRAGQGRQAALGDCRGRQDPNLTGRWAVQRAAPSQGASARYAPRPRTAAPGCHANSLCTSPRGGAGRRHSADTGSRSATRGPATTVIDGGWGDVWRRVQIGVR